MIRELKDPEYTGRNRCLPCTIGNITIAVIVAAALSVVSFLVSAAFSVAAIIAIYFKGYLIPGTPKLTRRYFPSRLLAAFGKEPTTATGLTAGDNEEPGTAIGPNESSASSLDLEDFLVQHGLVKATADGTDLRLTSAFQDEWHTTVNTIRDGDLTASQVANMLAIDADSERSMNRQDGNFSLIVDGSIVGRWPSRPALLADIAAAKLLSVRVDDWGDYAVEQRGTILNGLRVFLEGCPGTREPISLSEETVESCCTSQQVIALVCDKTGDRLLEQPME